MAYVRGTRRTKRGLNRITSDRDTVVVENEESSFRVVEVLWSFELLKGSKGPQGLLGVRPYLAGKHFGTTKVSRRTETVIKNA